ncbi:MAG: GH13_9 / GH13_8 / GH13 / GH13_10 / CBM48, partial [uncultured Quadrisphaera sp.]
DDHPRAAPGRARRPPPPRLRGARDTAHGAGGPRRRRRRRGLRGGGDHGGRRHRRPAGRGRGCAGRDGRRADHRGHGARPGSLRALRGGRHRGRRARRPRPRARGRLGRGAAGLAGHRLPPGDHLPGRRGPRSRGLGRRRRGARPLRRRRHGRRGGRRRVDHGGRRPVPLPADDQRVRPAPGLRGPPRGAVGGARRPRAPLLRPDGRGHRHLLRRLGAPGPRGPGGRRLQRLGRAAHDDALPGRLGGVGGLPAQRGQGRALQVRAAHRRRALGRAGRPDGPGDRGAAVHGVGGHRVRARLGRRRVDGPARGHRPAHGADEHLRGAPGVLEAGPELPRGRRGARRPRAADGLHARRADARGRAPLRRLLGLPGHRVLRADLAVRRPRRLPVPRRPAAPGRHRGDRRLGARALPQGRVGPGPVRRRAAVRVPRPAQGRAPRLGHPGLRLRAPRGAQLPRRQRPVLADGVPRRRAAGRRRRLDALPGLLPRGRPVDPQQVRGPRAPGGDRVPPGGQRHRLPAGAGHRDDRRGVDVVAGGHPAHRRGRPGLRPEVEHGLDARLAALRGRGPGEPHLAPRRGDLLAGVRVQRELPAADQPRRGRARQGLAAAQGARRPLAAAGHAARVLRLHVGPPGQAAALHGPGVRPGGRVGGVAQPRLVAARPAAARGAAGHRQRPQPPLPRDAGAVGAGRGAVRLRVGRLPGPGAQHVLVRARRPLRSAPGGGGELRGGAARGLPARPAAGRGVARGAQHRRRGLRGLGRGQQRAARGAGGAAQRPAGVHRGARAAARGAVAGARRRGGSRRQGL